MFRKIDIYADGVHVCSTNQAKDCKEAEKRFKNNPVVATIGKNGIEQKKIYFFRLEAKYAN